MTAEKPEVKQPPDEALIELHEKLLRYAKGMINAWEKWLEKKKGN